MAITGTDRVRSRRSRPLHRLMPTVLYALGVPSSTRRSPLLVSSPATHVTFPVRHIADTDVLHQHAVRTGPLDQEMLDRLRSLGT